MARDPMTPVDQTPDEFTVSETNPSQTLPPAGAPVGSPRAPLNPGESSVEYDFFLRDGAIPYRRPTGSLIGEQVYGPDSDGWYQQLCVDPTSLWPSDANEIAGIIGDATKVNEPAKGMAPYVPMPGSDYGESAEDQNG